MIFRSCLNIKQRTRDTFFFLRSPLQCITGFSEIVFSSGRNSSLLVNCIGFYDAKICVERYVLHAEEQKETLKQGEKNSFCITKLCFLLPITMTYSFCTQYLVYNQILYRNPLFQQHKK